ncbi:MAG TPA: HAD-IIA family hydrolase [Acidimicrobiales bacterium]|nr:HAD-IIA family hydrolase [Acidimicrobiales bacterium]
MTWALDLDGVVWLADTPIPGAAEAVDRLRRRGERVVFLTNNSSPTVDHYVDKLGRMGIPTAATDVVTSAQAAARLLEPGTTALLCAGPGVEEALAERGVRVVRHGNADAVVVGWHRDFDFDRLAAATAAIHGGARLIGTNEDATYPTPEGELPGGGALLAAVATAGGVVPVVAGKPHEPMAALVAERVGAVDVMVGDRPSTDGLFARRLGARFALVLSGVTSADDLPVVPEPDEVASGVADLVA